MRLGVVLFLVCLNGVTSEKRRNLRHHNQPPPQAHEQQQLQVENHKYTCEEMFRALDVDGSGLVTKSDLEIVLSSIEVSREKIQNELSDVTDFAAINMNEFCSEEKKKSTISVRKEKDDIKNEKKNALKKLLKDALVEHTNNGKQAQFGTSCSIGKCYVVGVGCQDCDNDTQKRAAAAIVHSAQSGAASCLDGECYDVLKGCYDCSSFQTPSNYRGGQHFTDDDDDDDDDRFYKEKEDAIVDTAQGAASCLDGECYDVLKGCYDCSSFQTPSNYRGGQHFTDDDDDDDDDRFYKEKEDAIVDTAHVKKQDYELLILDKNKNLLLDVDLP